VQPRASVQAQAVSEEPFHALLYRYWFFNWLFMDASRGSLFERAAALRHNRRQARWLPTYMRRWLALGLACCALGAIVEATGSVMLAAMFFLPGVLAFPVNAVIAAAWVGLRIGE
jgi:fatty acid desaturase